LEITPVTKDDITHYRKDVLARTPPDQRAVSEAMLNAMPYPRTRPAFRNLIADADDRIWVQIYPTPGVRSGTWLVLDPRTKTSAVFVGPPDFELLDVSRNTVCGVSRGALDVESVRCFDLLSR
jgi:hypothetical protein